MNQKRAPSYRELKQRLALEEARQAYIKQALRVIRQANQLILHENNPKRLIERACTILTGTPGYHSAWLALLDQAGVVTTTASSGFAGGFEAVRDRLERGDFPARVKQTLEQEEMMVINEPPADCPLGGKYADRAGLTRRLAYGGRVYGILAVSVPAAYAHDAEAQELFDELAGVLAFALHKIETEAHRYRLEQIITTIPHPMALVSRDYRYLAVNEAYAEYYEITQKEILGCTVADFYGQTRFKADIKPQLDRCLAGEAVRYEIRVDFPGQGQRWMAMEYYPFRDERGRVTGVVSHSRDITERKQVEAALRESEQRYRSLFTDSHTVMLLIDPDTGAIVDANPAACAYYGYTRQEIKARTVFEINTLPAEQVSEKMQRARNGARQHFFFRHCLATGEVRDVEVYSGPIQVHGQQLLYSIINDITERRQAEAALQESEKRYRDLVESIRDSVYVLDREWRHILVNEAAEQFTGIPGDRLLGAKLTELFPGVERTPFFAAFQRVMETCEAEITMGEYTFADGRSGWYEVYVFPVREGILCISRDITERKEAEEALRDSEELFRTVFEQTAVGVAQVIPDGRLTKVNARFCDIVGYTPVELSALTFRDITHPDDLRLDDHNIARVVAGEIDSFEIEKRYLHKSGRTVWVRLFSNVVRNEDGSVRYAIAAVADITRQREADRKLRKSERKFRTLVENTMDWVWQVDRAGRYTYTSPNTEKIMGYGPEELRGKRPFDFMEAEEARRVDAFFAEAAGNRERIAAFENTLLHRDGRPVIFETNATPLFDDEGLFQGYFGICRDITERKEAEAALRDSEEKFRRLIEQSADGIALADHQGLVVAWNRTRAQMTGLEPAEAIGRPIWEILYRMAPEELKNPALFEYLQSTTIEASKTGRAPWLNRLVERESQHPDGPRRILQSTLFPVKTSRGFAVGNITRDVTQQKRTEAALRASERRYRSLVEQSLQGVVIAQDNPVSLRFASRPMEEITGYSPQELTNFGPEQLAALIHLEDRQTFLRNFRARLAGQAVPARREYRLTHKHGETRWVEVHSSRIEYEGRPVTQTVFLDITERKLAEEALRVSEARFRRIFEENPLGIAIVSPERQRFVQANRRFCEMLGYTEAELLDLGVTEITYAEDRERENQFIIRAMQGELRGYAIEKRYVKKNSDLWWGKLTGVMIPDTSREGLVGLGMVEDITERKLAEAERERLVQELRATLA